MHMADALLSPAVGAGLWAASGGLIVLSSVKLERLADDSRVPLMGVAGAFVFAAQMINFAIPGTGSSGHLGGGLLLCALLGPWAGFLTMASVLVVQALFFADGGLLALGCNIFNLGFFPCFVAYPLLFRPLAGRSGGPLRLGLAAVVAAVVGLQLGSLAVVLQTTASGITELPFGPFALLMQPIHLAIGLVEGLATAAVLLFVRQARPELLQPAAAPRWSSRSLLLSLGAATLVLGTLLSWFASSQPDGLEWSMAGASGHEELEAPEHAVHASLDRLQQHTALLPDYALPRDDAPERLGTSLSGLVGSSLTLGMAALLGLAMRRRRASP
jgi:cobalt/nickel transport system permease protein